jgi:DNA topoisomerase-3
MGVSQGGASVALQWERGRVFDRDVCAALHKLVLDAGVGVVTAVAVKEERKPRPPGLNTVEMLKVGVSLAVSLTLCLSHRLSL